jgi:hypothetical protein
LVARFPIRKGIEKGQIGDQLAKECTVDEYISGLVSGQGRKGASNQIGSSAAALRKDLRVPGTRLSHSGLA